MVGTASGERSITLWTEGTGVVLEVAYYTHHQTCHRWQIVNISLSHTLSLPSFTLLSNTLSFPCYMKSHCIQYTDSKLFSISTHRVALTYHTASHHICGLRERERHAHTDDIRSSVWM